jgi:hypothetical protein
MENSELDNHNFLITHIGEGRFNVTLSNGEIKSAGPSLCGMVRYTYFEDYTIPEIGWSVTNKQLITDYHPKASKDIIDGKLKPNQMNY